MAAIRGFFAFAICFALLLQVWHEQYRFFRRYNLQDSTFVFLNCTLLFLVLFYVYPLKFLFTFLINGWLGFAASVQIKGGQLPVLMEIFSGGFLAVAGSPLECPRMLVGSECYGIDVQGNLNVRVRQQERQSAPLQGHDMTCYRCQFSGRSMAVLWPVNPSLNWFHCCSPVPARSRFSTAFF